jgi:hypothetical protein
MGNIVDNEGEMDKYKIRLPRTDRPPFIPAQTATAQMQRTKDPSQDIAARRNEILTLDWKRDPLKWAEAQHRLGEAFLEAASSTNPMKIIQREEYYEGAATAFRQALKERTRVSVPDAWAESKSQLGVALFNLSGIAWQRSGKEAARTLLSEALRELRDALQEREFDKSPKDWEATQATLAEALAELAILDGSEATREAMDAYQLLFTLIKYNRIERPNPATPAVSRSATELFKSSLVSAIVPPAAAYGESVRDKSIITRNGKPYLPLSLAAAKAQADESTVRKWITNRVKFGGRAIDTYSSLTKDIYVSEDSATKMAQRFVIWPSGKPAGIVVLGETDDQSGFLGLMDTARILKVGHHTIWLWVTQEKAPTGKPLDVIKCTVSDRLYVREKDIAELKRMIPRSGLSRGRRAREAAPQ